MEKVYFSKKEKYLFMNTPGAKKFVADFVERLKTQNVACSVRVNSDNIVLDVYYKHLSVVLDEDGEEAYESE